MAEVVQLTYHFQDLEQGQELKKLQETLRILCIKNSVKGQQRSQQVLKLALLLLIRFPI